jgi:hypothetical protein
MQILKLSQMDCGGFGGPKGHLDTQMFPDCPDRSLTKQKHQKHQKHKKKHTCKKCKKSFNIYKIIKGE